MVRCAAGLKTLSYAVHLISACAAVRSAGPFHRFFCFVRRTVLIVPSEMSAHFRAFAKFYSKSLRVVLTDRGILDFFKIRDTSPPHCLWPIGFAALQKIVQ